MQSTRSVTRIIQLLVDLNEKMVSLLKFTQKNVLYGDGVLGRNLTSLVVDTACNTCFCFRNFCYIGDIA